LFDLFGIPLRLDQQLANGTVSGADREESLQDFNTPDGDCADSVIAAVMGMDHFAIVDVVGVAGDLLMNSRFPGIRASTSSSQAC